jgi:hypothetical protein
MVSPPLIRLVDLASRAVMRRSPPTSPSMRAIRHRPRGKPNRPDINRPERDSPRDAAALRNGDLAARDAGVAYDLAADGDAAPAA